jgi:hypothetical protein
MKQRHQPSPSPDSAELTDLRRAFVARDIARQLAEQRAAKAEAREIERRTREGQAAAQPAQGDLFATRGGR